MKYTIQSNEPIAAGVFRMRLSGDASAITRPGQFVNISLPGFFLRRPISVCDWDRDALTLVYRAVGAGTDAMSKLEKGASLDLLPGLGNGFDLSKLGARPLLVGGGVGAPPLLGLARRLAQNGQTPAIRLGFRAASDVMLVSEFEQYGEVRVATEDGSLGARGFVTGILPPDRTAFAACGPEPMLKALCGACDLPGQVSLEARMACGFGACMGCSRKTKDGMKRVCADGPVFDREVILW